MSAPASTKTILSIAGGVMIAVGMIPIALSFILGQSNQEFLTRAESTPGQVVELLSETSRPSPNNNSSVTIVRPRVVYRDRQGMEKSYTSPFGTSPPNYEVGESVEVLFDPSNPEDVRLKKDIGNVESGFLVVGAIASCLGVAVILGALLFIKNSES